MVSVRSNKTSICVSIFQITILRDSRTVITLDLSYPSNLFLNPIWKQERASQNVWVNNVKKVFWRETECTAADQRRSTSRLVSILWLAVNIYNCGVQRFQLRASSLEALVAVLVAGLMGALFSLLPFSTGDYKKITSSVSRHDWIQAHRSPPLPPPPAWRLVNAALRGSIQADVIKRVAYEATAGLHTLLHRQLPPARPPPSTPYLLTYPSRLHGLPDLLMITVIKEAMNRGNIIKAEM